jgi:cytochrome c556
MEDVKGETKKGIWCNFVCLIRGFLLRKLHMSKRILTISLLFALGSTFCLRADTLTDESFHKLMKEVGGTTKRFKNSIQAQDGATLSKDAARVAEIYKQMGPFWTARKADDAVKWSEQSSAAANLLSAAAKKGDWAEVKTTSQGVMKNCKSCHEAHKEKLPDGSSKIK